MEQVRGSTGRTVRLVVLVIAGIVLGNVLVTLLMTRDTGLGVDELVAFAGGAVLGLLVEFGVFRRSGR
ncbi:hypothetical protein HD597_010224 [Nonomuraea thailandensis]|uniref:Uncharacterized protein n=1 Tax=Nonomuraea thailandensis TaxID=1188745 RepID=A0A9X2K866_9ACTN|nr:hypothetical protein [Nonomuraea thailandensis]MCP2363204.1 hypothetical protein [Nonomuraea thailandensis]